MRFAQIQIEPQRTLCTVGDIGPNTTLYSIPPLYPFIYIYIYRKFSRAEIFGSEAVRYWGSAFI